MLNRSGTGPTAPIPIVIDTDIGADPDDALALIFALASPEVDVLGITVVDGDVDLRARMAARLLGMAGRADIPVIKGRSMPIGPGRGPTMLGFEGRGLLDVDYAGPDATILDTPAPEWIVEMSKEIDFHLVAIGPLSNVAVAVETEPAFVHRLRGLTIMGGVLDVDSLPAPWRERIERNGLVAGWPDHNTASDPTAALICARSGARITWVTNEVTLKTPLPWATRNRLPANTPLGNALGRMIDSWDTYMSGTMSPACTGIPELANTAVFLHDPLTVAALFPSDWLMLSQLRLNYGIENGLFRLRGAGLPCEATASVSIAIDAVDFHSVWRDRVLQYLERVDDTHAASRPG
jgi:purine nucleosidase